MTITDIIGSLLTPLNVTYYDSPPEFPEGEEPELYIYYTLYSTPKLRGGGVLMAEEYTITLTVSARSVARADILSEQVRDLFEENGFVWTGCNYSRDNDFPRGNLNSMDFKYVIERTM
jgi:hypothetical protein